ncbi:Gfo/Idh/MocA family protein [Pelosinus sp. UFO1]|uniref:Gfo/Idh/MocA family protein n=1 Tax=Pelosinus sp. UFO1 TaxID=484770 RepID=UPI0004D16DE5|nr:Gfo/Idh/MocA family oxidoreductase [Pelosinus sp. UFO1]AIF52999.1 oxidoreductase domain protein [Pelosinus sp. UFO1]
MEKIRSGIIGTGFIGPAHIEALRRLGCVDVLAIADYCAEVAQKKAEELYVPRYYGDYKELLADKDIEVVHICTPNHLHFPIAKEALLAGKHVICEKPLALNSAEAEELTELAQKSNLVHAVHYNLRFYPLMHQVKQMIENGELGEILAVNGSYQQDWLFYDTDYNWRLDPKFSGDSRAVADIGSHWLDLVEFVTGIQVEQVCADFAIFHPIRKKPLKAVETYGSKVLASSDYEDVPIDTEDYASVLLHFNNGAHGSVTINQVAAGRKNRLFFEIYGAKKAVAWDSERPNELWQGRRDGNNEILLKDPSLLHQYARDVVSFPGGHNEGYPDTSKQMFKKVYECIQAKIQGHAIKPEFATFESGQRELMLCEKIVKSAREQRWL